MTLLIQLLMMVFYSIGVVTLPPCEYEDSTDCYWDASTMGNGIGTSFVAISLGGEGDTSIAIRADGTFDMYTDG